MFQVEIEAGLPYVIDADADDSWDISGVISVAGSLSGLLVMRYTGKLARFMLQRARLTYTDSTQHRKLLNDMIGEVANTVAGNVLSDIGIDELMISVPVAIRGENHIISWPGNTEVVAIPFNLSTETFVVQIGLK